MVNINPNKIGENFEKRLTLKFEEYRKECKCFISKIPTSWTVIRKGKQITTAFPNDKSQFLDYVGCTNDGKILFLEAKSCNNKTRFPLNNIKPYQFKLIEEYLNYTDRVYIIVEMRHSKEVFLFHAQLVLDFEEKYKRKSIPLKWLQDNCIKVNDLDILKWV